MNQIYSQDFRITPEFLNPILQAAMGHNTAAILEVRQEKLGGENPLNAVLLRLYLTSLAPQTTAPLTLIAKLPTGNMELHERAEVFQPGVRENWFYGSGATVSPIHVPHCYYHATDSSTGESILLLEDLAPALPGSWLKGASLAQAELALQALARFHAHWWGKADSKEIQELDRLLADSGDGGQNLVQELYKEAWPQFIRQMGEMLPDDVRQFGAAIVDHKKEVDALNEQRSQTLTHGDYRLDNMLFGSKEGESICWVLDWEDVFFGDGMIDVSWFLGGCLPIEESQHETDLLRGYYQTLKDEGVADYTWDQCYQGYRRAMVSSFVQGVLSATLDVKANEDEYKLARVIGQRFMAAAQRLDLQEFMCP